MDDTDTQNNFEYRGWLVSMEVSGSGADFSGHADLRLNGVQKCRVVLGTSRDDRSSARWALDSKARDYIDNWVANLHTGTTDFGDLGEN
jgi:hypothetical protein